VAEERVDASSGDALEAFYSALLDDDPTVLYERAPCGYLSTAPDGTIIKVNQTFLTLTGHERGALVGRRRLAELLTPGGQIYYETHYAPMLQMQGTAREIAFDIVRADGCRLPVLVNSVLERDPSGAPAVIRTAVFDATERREYERELVRAKQRAEASETEARALARTLQQTLIPPAPPAIPGLDVAAAYRPAGSGDEVGGDFYDIFEVADGGWVVAVGDVCGKGVEAAVITALARHTIRAAAVGHDRPSAILAVLDEVLRRHETDRFCTVALLRMHPLQQGWACAHGSGGHDLPVLCRTGAEPIAVGTPGSLLGVLEDASFHDTDVELGPGDAIVLFTDGLTEARRDGEFFGVGRLRAAIATHAGSAGSVAEGVLQEVLEFQGQHTRDDIALVVVRVPETEA